MRIQIISGVLLLCAFYCSAQQPLLKTAINNKWDYTIELRTTNKLFEYKIIKGDDPEHPVTFTLQENNEALFVNAFTSLLESSKEKLELSTNGLKEEANRLFFFFKAGEILIPSLKANPLAGTIEVNSKTIPVYKLMSTSFTLKALALDSFRRAKHLWKGFKGKPNPYHYKKSDYLKALELGNKLTDYRDSLEMINDSLTYLDTKNKMKAEENKIKELNKEIEVKKKDIKKAQQEVLKLPDSRDTLRKIIQEITSTNITLLKVKATLATAVASTNSLKESSLKYAELKIKLESHEELLSEAIRIEREIQTYLNSVRVGDYNLGLQITDINNKIGEAEKIKNKPDSLKSNYEESFENLETLKQTLIKLKLDDYKNKQALRTSTSDSARQIKQINNLSSEITKIKTELTKLEPSKFKLNEFNQLIDQYSREKDTLESAIKKLNSRKEQLENNSIVKGNLNKNADENEAIIKSLIRDTTLIHSILDSLTTVLKEYHRAGISDFDCNEDKIIRNKLRLEKSLKQTQSTLSKMDYAKFDSVNMGKERMSYWFYIDKNYYSKYGFKKLLREKIFLLRQDSALFKRYYTYYSANEQDILNLTMHLKNERIKSDILKAKADAYEKRVANLKAVKHDDEIEYKSRIQSFLEMIEIQQLSRTFRQSGIHFPDPIISITSYDTGMSRLKWKLKFLMETNLPLQNKFLRERLVEFKNDLDALTKKPALSVDESFKKDYLIKQLEDIERHLTENDSLKKIVSNIEFALPVISFSGTKYNHSYNEYSKGVDSLNFITESLNRVNAKIQNCIIILSPIKKALNILIGKSYDPNFHKQTLKIDEVQIEINDGLMENILVSGKIGNQYKYINDEYELRDTLVLSNRGTVKFENRYAMGFSTKRDYEKLSERNLLNIDRNNPNFKLEVKDLIISYIQNHQPNRRDYSPADTTLNLNPNSEKRHALSKEPTYKIFEAKIFSDFVGLDRTNPNGLIQTEIERKINLFTSRYPFRLGSGYEIWNLGIFNYIIPQLVVSKLEQSNRDLLIGKDTISGKFTKYTSTLELRRHENFCAGFDLNIASVDIPTIKSTFYIDAGIRYGRVAIVDSVKSNASPKATGVHFGVDTWQPMTKLIWLIRPDERYQFKIYGGFNFYKVRDNYFRQVSNLEAYETSGNAGPNSNVYGNLAMQFTFRPNPGNANKGALFFRYQYNWQANYFNTGFHQAQVGYSIHLIGKR